MKKILAVFLSVIVLLTSCMCVFGTLADEPKNYASPDSWLMYMKGHATGAYPEQLDNTSTQKWGFKASDAVKYDEKDTLQFIDALNGKAAATKLEGLTVGTEYVLSFKYYVPSAHKASSLGHIFKAGIYKHNTPVETNGDITSKSYMDSEQVIVDTATGMKDNAPVWEEMSFTFTATEDAQYLGISVFYGWQEGDDYSNLYFADFNIVKAPKKYILPSSWLMYMKGHATGAYPEQLDNTSTQNWGFKASESVLYNEKNTLQFTDAMNQKAAATLLEGLTPGTEYVLSFKYYVPSAHKVSSAGHIFKAGIYKHNTPVEANGNITSKSYMDSEQVIVDTATGKEADEPVWNDISFTFTATEEAQYLGISVFYGWQEGDDYGNLYFADFNVVKAPKKYVSPSSWLMYMKGHATGAYPEQIDNTSIQNWGFKASETVKYEEKDTLQFTDAMNQKAAATLLENLTPGTEYVVSFKYYVPSAHKKSSAGHIFKAGIYKHNTPVEANGDITSKSYMLADQVIVDTATGKEADEPVWKDMSFTFTAIEEAQYLGISVFYGWQEGDDYGNLYFADFKVEEAAKLKNYADNTLWWMYLEGHASYPAQIDGTSAQQWASVDSTTVKYEDKSTVKFSDGANGKVLATKLEGLTAGQIYRVSMKYYVPSAHKLGSAGYIFMAGVYKENVPVLKGNITDKSYFLSAQTNVTEATGEDDDTNPVWEELTIDFTASEENQYLALAFLYGWQEGNDYGNIYVSEVYVKESDADAAFCATTPTDLFYCEDAYNLITSDEKYADLFDAKSGVYSFKVKANTSYTFSANVSGKGNVALSLNGKTPMSADITGVPSGMVEATGEANAKAMDFFSSAYTKVYILVENVEEFKIEDIMLFATKSINEASVPMGYTDNPNEPYVEPEIRDFKAK